MKARELGALLLLGSIWGASYLFIKVAVQVFPPLTLVTLRVVMAALTSLLILRMRGIALPRSRALWGTFLVMGLFNGVVPYSLITWGEQRIDSGLTAILIATSPIFTAIFAHLFLHDERMTVTKIVGILLGFAGVAILIGPAAVAGAGQSLMGDLAVVLASASYGATIVYARKHLRGVTPMAASAGQMVMASAAILPVALLVDQPWRLSLSDAGAVLPAVAALVMLAVVGTSLAYLLYYWLIREVGATNASLVTYISPFTSILWGTLLLGERLKLADFVGFGFILAGLAVINGYVRQIAQRFAAAGAGR